ncbi:portal protein [Rhodopseudomonas sp. RCAM05734]|uniref:portal protein n=1 Tax=Rhodopseudomonas sp. RCAM05734 TaxID=3457549 RepID=UPI004044E6C5
MKKAFRFGLTDILAARPQMTAEEVMGYKSDELKQLAPNLVRVYRGIGGFVARRANIIGRMPGMIAPPPPELQGQPISPKFVSPFTKAQKSERAQGVLGWVRTIEGFAANSQDPSWMDHVDADGVVNVLHDAMTGEPNVKRDPREVEQIRKSRQAAQQQQVELSNAAARSEVNANNAHAAQAQTLARSRKAS